MLTPTVIEATTFQQAWLSAARLLLQRSWATWNLVVQIRDVAQTDEAMAAGVTRFCIANDLLTPKEVCYTIFPYKLYHGPGTREALFHAYRTRFFPRTQRLLRGGNWGTYFQRMMAYPTINSNTNQLDNIIAAINGSVATMGAAYTIAIQVPGTETVRRRGGPCLNHIALQMVPGHERRLGMVALYRNHDFLQRAYGNYWGLCWLLRFLCAETNCSPGPLTCVSSHAYVPSMRTKFSDLLATL